MVKKFEDVLDIINGKNQKKVENPNGEYPIYGSGGVMGYADDYICEANTIVIGRKGSINNPIYVEEPFWNVDTAFGLVAKQNVLLPKYLYYFCVHYDFNKLNTTVTIPSLTKSNLLNIEMDVPNIEKQKKIVSELDSVARLIELQKKQIEEYDEIIKSRFAEMFGDRWSNNMNWLSSSLREVTDFYNGKAHEKVIDETGEYILVTSRCIASDQRDVRRTNALLFPLQIGDICMVMSDVPNGKALAKCMYIDKNGTYTLNQRICCFRNYILDSVFFLYLLNRHEYLLSFNNGDSQTNLRKNDLLDCPIIIPPLEKQNEFADFVRQIDKLKVERQKNIKKTQILFDSLMQQYFG